MRKLTFLFILFISSSLIDRVYAQTYEDTKDWIREKLDKYGDKVFWNIENDKYSQSYISLLNNDCINIVLEQCKPTCKDRTIRFNIADITNFSWVDQDIIEVITPSQKIYDMDDSRYHESVAYFKLNWNAEPDLKNRFDKALKHLLSFKKKEVF